MIKTKTAFALADFDKEKILSRKFFSDLKLPENLSDDDILKNLHRAANNFLNNDDVKNFDDVLKKFVAIEKRLEEYQQKIAHHIQQRLFRYSLALVRQMTLAEKQGLDENSKRIDERSRRAVFLSDNYAQIAKIISELKPAVKQEREDLKSQISRFYRKWFSSRVKQIRKNKNVTQAELSAITGISQSDIAGYEAARKTPSFENLIKFCRGLDISADWILGLARV